MNFVVDVQYARRVAAWEKTNHIFTVRQDGGGLYVNAADFGCSRTYATSDPVAAIYAFLAEHACTPHNIREG